MMATMIEYLDLQDKWDSARRAASIIKEQVGKGSIGKPLVEQYEEMKYCAKEMKEHTVRIIVILFD